MKAKIDMQVQAFDVPSSVAVTVPQNMVPSVAPCTPKPANLPDDYLSKFTLPQLKAVGWTDQQLAAAGYFKTSTVVAVPLNQLDVEVLEQLCADFRGAVLAKAGIVPPLPKVKTLADMEPVKILPSVQTARDEFEKFIVAEHPNLPLFLADFEHNYDHDTTENYWNVWRKSRGIK